MEVTQISINNIKAIIDRIENSNYDCGSVSSIRNGEIENQRINDDCNKIIIRNASESVKVIIVDCKKNKINAISFNGTIEINPKELLKFFKNYREGYSMHDNLYFYFFNEDRKKGNYTLSFFEPSHKQIDIHQNDEYLSNLTLSWD